MNLQESVASLISKLEEAAPIDPATATKGKMPAFEKAPDGLPIIPAPTLSRANAIALAANLPKFRWCQKYSIKGPRGQSTKPVSPATQDAFSAAGGANVVRPGGRV